MDTGEDKPDSDIEYAGITVYDEYRTEQAEWLRRVLDSKEYKDAPFKIIVAHIPPIGGWHGNLEVEQKFMPLLRDAKELKIQVVDVDGKVVDQFSIKKP